MSLPIDVFSFIPPAVLQTLHWLAGLVVFAEGVNKLERTDPFARGLCLRQRVASILKLVAWLLLCVGAAGALITPFLRLEHPTLQDTAVMLGFGILIIRSRVKECAI
jgi:hypothetical protein